MAKNLGIFFFLQINIHNGFIIKKYLIKNLINMCFNGFLIKNSKMTQKSFKLLLRHYGFGTKIVRGSAINKFT